MYIRSSYYFHYANLIELRDSDHFLIFTERHNSLLELQSKMFVRIFVFFFVFFCLFFISKIELRIAQPPGLHYGVHLQSTAAGHWSVISDSMSLMSWSDGKSRDPLRTDPQTATFMLAGWQECLPVSRHHGIFYALRPGSQLPSSRGRYWRSFHRIRVDIASTI